MKFEWEWIVEGPGHSTCRVQIPGGWLIRERFRGDPNGNDYESVSVSLIFISDPHHSWTIDND